MEHLEVEYLPINELNPYSNNARKHEREDVRKEYDELVKKGVIRDKTAIEKTITMAHGHPDNKATQAARRMAEKRGYDWRTGKKKSKKK